METEICTSDPMSVAVLHVRGRQVVEPRFIVALNRLNKAARAAQCSCRLRWHWKNLLLKGNELKNAKYSSQQRKFSCTNTTVIWSALVFFYQLPPLQYKYELVDLYLVTSSYELTVTLPYSYLRTIFLCTCTYPYYTINRWLLITCTSKNEVGFGCSQNLCNTVLCLPLFVVVLQSIARHNHNSLINLSSTCLRRKRLN